MSSRVASGRDVSSLLAMMEGFNAHEGIPFDPRVFRPRLELLVRDPRLGGAIVLEEDGRDVAYAIVTFGFDLEYGGRDAFLTELWVLEELRGRGAGGRMLAAAEAFARDGGAHALHLLVRFDNRPARTLYERRGYETEPRAVMTKRLA